MRANSDDNEEVLALITCVSGPSFDEHFHKDDAVKKLGRNNDIGTDKHL